MIFFISGVYDIEVLGPQADDVIFSVTWSDGFMDDYVSFELPVVKDPLTDEEFDAIAVKPDLEFDNELPPPESNDTEVLTTEAVNFDATTEYYSDNTTYNASDLSNRYYLSALHRLFNDLAI